MLDLSQVDEKEEDKLPEFMLNLNGASQVTQWVKNLPVNVGDMVSIPGQEDPLEKEMATHSSILARETPWTEEPDRLQSMGSQRVNRT